MGDEAVSVDTCVIANIAKQAGHLTTEAVEVASSVGFFSKTMARQTEVFLDLRQSAPAHGEVH